MRLLLGVVWGLTVALGCSTDKDCSYRGVCQNQSCVCERPFAGDDCLGMNLVHRDCGKGGLCIDGQSTWGGGVYLEANGSAHMFAAFMAYNCTLNAWLTNSRALHAVASSLDEPFMPQDIALGPSSGDSWDNLTIHNPTIFQSPKDGSLNLFYMGNSGNEPVPHCSNEISGLPPGSTTQRVGLATSVSPYGPWKRLSSPVLEPGAKGEWDDIFVTNPSVFIFPNNSVLMLYKGRGTRNPDAMYTGVAVADSPQGPYRKIGNGPISNIPTECEDAGLFYGPMTKRFFALFHCGCAYLSIYSDDGLSWVSDTSPTPWCDITFEDGTRTVLKRRERPQFITYPNGTFAALTNGVEPPSNLHGGRVFTMISQPK